MAAQMGGKRHIIILGMSLIGPTANYVRDLFTYIGDDGKEYKGFQTNEAPVKYLLNRAHGDGHDINEIIYLRSKECRDNLVKTGNGSVVLDGPITTEALFINDIETWCKLNEVTIPEFKPVEYDPESPSNCLSDFIKQIGSDSRVYVDTTGALRDVINLITIAIQVVKMQSLCDRNATDRTGVELGPTVYANFITRPKVITSQNETYDLIDLVNAVDAFTRYGKAESLVSYFEKHDASDNMKELCVQMKAFSDSLSLCRTGNVENNVRSIHVLLNELADDDTTDISSGELLFRSLIPAIRDGFVKDISQGDSHAVANQLIETIRWCVDRQMLQQALALIDERTESILIDEGLLTWNKEFDNEILKSGSQNRMLDLVLWVSSWQTRDKNRPASGSDIIDLRAFTSMRDSVKGGETRLNKLWWYSAVGIWALPSLILPDRCYLDAEQKSKLAAALVWFFLLHGVRNGVMHANNKGGDKDRIKDFAKACAEAYTCTDGIIRPRFLVEGSAPELLAEDLRNALQALSGNVMLSLNAPWSDQLKRWARLRFDAEIEEEIDKAVKETGRRSVFLDEIYERLDPGAQMRFYDAVGNPSSITIADNNKLLSVFCTRHEADYSFGTTIGVKDNALPPEGLGELARFVFKDAKRIRGNIVLFDDVVATGRFESQDRSALRKRFKELRKQHPGLFELSCGCVVVHG